MPSTGNISHHPAGNIAWTITRRLGMVVILALAFFLSATITIYTLFRIGDTRVPDVLGKPESEAQKIVEKAGLRVKVVRRNDSAAVDTVIETRPGPNSSVKKDSTLSIIVSAGPAKGENYWNGGGVVTVWDLLHMPSRSPIVSAPASTKQ
jgi:hypothetical protein